MKGLAVAVIVLGVALALVVACFAAAAVAVARKLRQLGARRDQFLLRGDSGGADRGLLGTSSTIEFSDVKPYSTTADQLESGGQPGTSEVHDNLGVTPSPGLRGASLSRRGSGVSASSWELKALGDYHQHLLKMRLEGGLEGIEMGPILGRGSFGRVYKGRWQGALVAIKIVEHSLKGAAAEIEGARESLLAASISHPNVVACYKICTVRLNLPQGGSSDLDGEDSATTSLAAVSSPRVRLAGTAPALSPLDLQRKRSLERIRADQRAAAAGSAMPAALMRLTSAERRDILAGSPAGSALGQPVAASGIPGSRRGSLLATVPSEEEAPPHVALDVREEGALMLPQRGPSDASEETYPSEAGGDAEMALELEVLRSEELVHGVEEDQAVIETWMLLEYADRGSLDQAITARRFVRKADQLLDMGSAYRTLMDIATGMHYLHCLGIVHGDLKPANVLLKSTVTDSRGFVCKLADFGLSRVLDLNVTHLSTQSFGTVPYMPPELLSQGRMTKAVDVYSFGMLMWHLFAGEPPFKSMQMGQVLYGVVHCCARPELPPEMPAAYASLIECCWSADPEIRPAFQAIIEALHQQMQQHVASEKAAAAAASVATARGVSPFGAMSNLMKMRNKSSSSDSEGTRAAAAAAAAQRPLSVTLKDAADRQSLQPSSTVDAGTATRPAAMPPAARQAATSASLASQGSLAASPVRSSEPLARVLPAGSAVAGAIVTISRSASPKSSIGARSASSGSSGHLPAGTYGRSESVSASGGSPRRMLAPVAAMAARLRRSVHDPAKDAATTSSLSEPSMQKLGPGSRGLSTFSNGSLPAALLAQARQEATAMPGPAAPEAALRQPDDRTDASPWPAVEVNRSGSAPMARTMSAAAASARRASSAPPTAKAAIPAHHQAFSESAAHLLGASVRQAARPTTAAIPALPTQSAAEPFAHSPSPFATGSYAPPPPPGVVVAAGRQRVAETGNRSAMALAAEIVAANAVLAERARAKRANAAADKAQVGVDRATKALAGFEPSQASRADGDNSYNDRATTAAIDAAASAARHEAGSAAFLQQRYLETLRPAHSGPGSSSEVSQAIAAAAASVLSGPRQPEAADCFTRLVRTGHEAGGPLRYSVDVRRSGGPEMLPIAFRGSMEALAARARRGSVDVRRGVSLGSGHGGKAPLPLSRSLGDDESAKSGLLAGALAGPSPPPRSRSSPESSRSGGSGASSPGAAGPSAPVSAAGQQSGGSSFVLAASRLPAVPAALSGWGTAQGGVTSFEAAAAALAEQYGGSPAVDRAEPPGLMPGDAVAVQHTLHALNAQQVPHRLLPPLSPASSAQLRRHASSSTGASIDSRGSARSLTSTSSSASVRSAPPHVQRPPPTAASAGWAGIRGSLDVSGVDATVGEEVMAEGSGRSSPSPESLAVVGPASWPSPRPASAPPQSASGLAHPPEPQPPATEGALAAQTFAEAADAAVAAVEAEADP